MGGRLFDRSKNAVALTDLGQAMLPTLRQVFDAANGAREQARQLTSGQRPRVCVGVMCTIDFQHVLPSFVDVAVDGQLVEVSFREGNLAALTNALDLGEVDMALICSPQAMARRFRSLPLFGEHYVVAVGNDHRFNGRHGIEMAELDREHYCERMECEFTSHIERLLVARNVDLVVVQSARREDWIQAFVRSNFGIAFMPESLAHVAKLAMVRTLDCPIVRQVNLVLQSERPLSRAQQALIDALLATEWSMPWMLPGEADPPLST